jgi:hypothetical protein
MSGGDEGDGTMTAAQIETFCRHYHGAARWTPLSASLGENAGG